MHRRSIARLILLGPALAAFSAAAAEMPTDAQKAAIRSECRGDFIRNCSGVEPGGLPALQCLEDRMASLSDACQAAVRPVEAETGTGSAASGN